MKHLTRLLSLFLLVSAGSFFANCGGDDPQTTVEETQLNLLKANDWLISKVTGPSGDKTLDYPGMILKFTGTYGTPGGQYFYTSSANSWPDVSPWLEEGDWKFGSNVNSDLIMLGYNPVLNMTYAFLDSNTTLQIKFTSEGETFTNTNGRVNSVDGVWTFEFTKQ